MILISGTSTMYDHTFTVYLLHISFCVCCLVAEMEFNYHGNFSEVIFSMPHNMHKATHNYG